MWTKILASALLAGSLITAPLYAEEDSSDAGQPAEVQTSVAAGTTPRNPFAAPVPRGEPSAGDESGKKNREVVFDGSDILLPENMRSVEWQHVPRIKVTGLIEVNGSVAACAEVSNMGMMVLRPEERVIIRCGGPAKRDSREAPWFIVKSITRRNMTIELDDGTIIQGKFF